MASGVAGTGTLSLDVCGCTAHYGGTQREEGRQDQGGGSTVA